MNRKSKSDSNGRRWRVFLVDRHALMRRAAAEWINRTQDLEVCGTAGSIGQAFRAARQLNPDLVVSEIMRPHDLGFIRELHRRHPRLPILAFSTFSAFSMLDEKWHGAKARQAGVSGYLMKEAGGEQLVRSIRTLLRRGKAPALGMSKHES